MSATMAGRRKKNAKLHWLKRYKAVPRNEI